MHNLQAQLGCFAGPDEHEWQWLFEGMANELAFGALLDAGLVTAEEADLYVWGSAVWSSRVEDELVPVTVRDHPNRRARPS